MLIGRAHQRARIERLLAGARLGSSEVLVICGEPGIGKTALLQHAVERAGGMAVLRAHGVEPEAEVPFAGLLALLRPALGRLDDIPGPQAAALRTALALEPGEERDRFAIGAATLSLLAVHAERQPVLVAIERPCRRSHSAGSTVTRRPPCSSAAPGSRCPPERPTACTT